MVDQKYKRIAMIVVSLIIAITNTILQETRDMKTYEYNTFLVNTYIALALFGFMIGGLYRDIIYIGYLYVAWMFVMFASTCIVYTANQNLGLFLYMFIQMGFNCMFGLYILLRESGEQFIAV